MNGSEILTSLPGAVQSGDLPIRMELELMPCEKELKIQAYKLLRDATWTCQECGGDMPLEYEEDDGDEVGYRIVGATCESCGMINDSTINNDFGRKLDECSTREWLGI